MAGTYLNRFLERAMASVRVRVVLKCDVLAVLSAFDPHDGDEGQRIDRGGVRCRCATRGFMIQLSGWLERKTELAARCARVVGSVASARPGLV